MDNIIYFFGAQRYYFFLDIKVYFMLKTYKTSSRGGV